MRRIAQAAGTLAAIVLLVCAVGAGSALAAPPANDDFASAQVVGPGLPVEIATNNIEATAEAGEPSHYSPNTPRRTVWFSWTAPSNAKVTVRGCDPDLRTQVAVYTGSAVDELTKVEQFGECLGRIIPVAGTTYSIVVGSLFEAEQGKFTFSLRQFAPPSNDNFAGSLTVAPSLPVAVQADNFDSTAEAGEPSVIGGPGDGRRSVWFSWTAPRAAPVRVETCGFDFVAGAQNKALAVFTGATIGSSLNTVAGGNGACRASFDAAEGVTYRIAFSGTEKGEGTFTLRLLEETPPANDDFSGAQVVGPGLPVAVAGSNLFSTVESGEPHHGNDDEGSFSPNDTVWYRWTPTASTEVRIGVCDADFSNPRLGVYTGGAVGSLTRVTPSAAQTSFPFCAIRFNAAAGITYRIAVGSAGNETEGGFPLDIHVFAPPANDDFAGAQPIGPALPISVRGSNVDSSAEAGEPDHSQYDEGSAYTSVWYSWTPSASSIARVRTCGTDFSSVMSIYTGGSVGALTKLAAGEGGCGSAAGHSLDFGAIAGVRYLIAVGGLFRDEEGPFTLTVVDPFALPTPAIAPPSPPVILKKPVGRNWRALLRKRLRKCRKPKGKKAHRRSVKKARRRGIKKANRRSVKKARRRGIKKANRRSVKKVRHRCVKKARRKTRKQRRRAARRH